MKKILLASLFILALTSQYALAAIVSQGQDQKLEWEVVRKFDIGSKPIDIAHSLDGKYAFVLTDKHVVTVYDQTGSLQGSIPVEQGVNAITIDPMGKFLHLSDSVSNTFYTLALDFVIKINSAKAPTKGDMNAPVTIAVFSDFQ
jgi:DNA-binding beta-propeller fold protein YncE